MIWWPPPMAWGPPLMAWGPPPVPGPSTMVAAMISRMMPLATPSAPGEKCSSRVSMPPRIRSSAATRAAVVSILRRTRRLVDAVMPAVISRNGTSAILGPIPIRSSRKVSMTKAASSDSSSFTRGTLDHRQPAGARNTPSSPPPDESLCLVVGHRVLVPLQAVAGDIGQVQLAGPDLERAREHGVGPVLPLQPLPARSDAQQVAGDLRVQMGRHRDPKPVGDRGRL